jgi:glycosyltransferase involved in cell wall biosynthesis
MNSIHASTGEMTLNEILSFHDERFVQCAYEVLLGRKPDDKGLQFYLASVRSGTKKIEILAQVRLSPEGKTRSVNVMGLDEAISRHLMMNWPVLGALLSFFMKASSENTTPFIFDSVWYMQEYPDVAESGMQPYYHYSTFGKDEGRCPAFDSEWYLSEYPDVAGSGRSPREHYEKYGKAEKRFPWFDANWYLKTYQDVATSGIDPRAHYYQFGKAEGRYPAYSIHNGRNDYRKWVADFDTLTAATRADMQIQCKRFANTPLISVVMPVYNPNSVRLIQTIESIKNQIYPNWELCIADDLSRDPTIRPMLARYREEDVRIKVIFHKEREHISAATNSALMLASGEWIVLMDYGDLLSEHAFFWVVDAINKAHNVRMMYSDEDKIDDQGVRSSPYFKCDWNPDLFYSQNIVSHSGVYHASLISCVGGFRVGFDGAQKLDLALRCSELIDSDQIHHIPRVLYHCRADVESVVCSSAAKQSAVVSGEKAINEHFQRRGIAAKVESLEYCYRARYSLPKQSPLVSLIIPTRNGATLLRQCVDSILLKTAYRAFEILIIDNGSDDPETLRYLKSVCVNRRVRMIRDPHPFNYSALNNAAVKLAAGEIIGLINDDIEVISPDWLSEMVSHAIRPEVGAVGARLWYPNNTLQHGGVIIGFDCIAFHAHKNLKRQDRGYMARAICIQSFSAVTGACLLIRKSIYESLGGLNEVDLQVAFNDVDFCIRVRDAGYRNIWTPYAELYHHESATRGADDTPAKRVRLKGEIAYMRSRWVDALAHDPAYNPNLTVASGDFSLAWPPRVERFDLASYRN